MNKLITTVIMSLLCCPQAWAQSRLQTTNSERGISVGINGSFNIPTFAQNNDNDRSDFSVYPIGWGAGFFVNIPFTKTFSFQGEIQYDRFRAFSTGGWAPRAPYLVFEYIAVPLLAQYEFGRRKMFFLNFGART